MTELLYGERVKVFAVEEGWAWVKAAHDGYVGYVPASALSREITSSAHRVAVPSDLHVSRARHQIPDRRWPCP